MGTAGADLGIPRSSTHGVLPSRINSFPYRFRLLPKLKMRYDEARDSLLRSVQIISNHFPRPDNIFRCIRLLCARKREGRNGWNSGPRKPE